MIRRLKENASLALHWTFDFVLSLLAKRRRLIVFSNYNGRGYGDNLAPIADEILRRGDPVRMIWLVNDLCEKVPKGIEKLKRGWIREKLCLASAKIFISNTKGTPSYRKKRGSYYIQTWHGDMPFKFVEAECKDMLSRYYRVLSIADSRRTDYVLSGSSFFSNLARQSFWYPSSCKVLEYGIPRNDIFFKTSRQEVLEFKRKEFGSENVRVVLYAPTFRDRIPNEVCRIDAPDLCRAMERRFGGNWVVVIRLHPVVARRTGMFNFDSKTINGTLIENGQMLSLASDVLVSDYSSIVEEFILQRKPVFLYTPDYNAYIAKERRLRDLYLRLPFPRCENMDKLFQEVIQYDEDEYRRKLDLFIDSDYQIFDDGRAGVNSIVGL